MTIFTTSKPMDEKTIHTGDADATAQTTRPKTWPRAAAVVVLVLVTAIVSAAAAGTVVHFTATSCHDHEEPSHRSDVDMDFERRGHFDRHSFRESCHYDHQQSLLIMDIVGHGFGENATVVYDIERGFMTYIVPHLSQCFISAIEPDDVTGLLDADNGAVIELGNVQGRNFTASSVTIPQAFLERTMSPVINELCSTMDSHWMMRVSEEETSPGQRVRRDVIIIVFSDGTVVIIY